MSFVNIFAGEGRGDGHLSLVMLFMGVGLNSLGDPDINWLKWVGQLWQSGLLFLRDMLQKKKHLSSGEYPFRSSHDHGFRSL